MMVDKYATALTAAIFMLLTTQGTPALASGLSPHVYNRGVHGHVDLKCIGDAFVRCPGLKFGELYLGNSVAEYEHFLRARVIPGGRYGRQDRRSLERCLRQNRP